MKTTTQTGRTHRGALPTKDTDIADVALHVAKMWVADPTVTVKFTDSERFNTLVTEFRGMLDQKSDKLADRRGISIKLHEMDGIINRGLRQVKVYLADKYETEATEHYARFGIVHEGGGFRLPVDQSKKRDALRRLKAAIAEDGFGNFKYGTDYWETTFDRFNSLLSDARIIDGEVSEIVAAKKQKREEIVRAINALIFTFRAADPENYTATLRKWGIQKDKF